MNSNKTPSLATLINRRGSFSLLCIMVVSYLSLNSFSAAQSLEEDKYSEQVITDIAESARAYGGFQLMRFGQEQNHKLERDKTWVAEQITIFYTYRNEISEGNITHLLNFKRLLPLLIVNILDEDRRKQEDYKNTTKIPAVVSDTLFSSVIKSPFLADSKTGTIPANFVDESPEKYYRKKLPFTLDTKK